MQGNVSETIYSAVPLFDVVVTMPSTAKLQTIQELAATQAGMPPDRVERLIKVLRSSPHAKVGSAITLELAEEEKIRFSKAGLLVDITPVLTLQTTTSGSFDGKETCPACGKRSVMPANRQCPSCGVFVEKLTDDYLLRKKLTEHEHELMELQRVQAAMNAEKSARESVEAAIREQIKQEFEKKYGLSKGSLIQGKSGFLIGVALAALAGLAYMGETGVTIAGLSLPWGKKETVEATDMSAACLKDAETKGLTIGAMSERVGQKDTVAAANISASSPQQASGGASAVGERTGDVDIDDPLIQAAGGKRTGAKGLTIQEAVAAANVLGKSVGNTTAERALAGAAPAGGANAGKAQAGGSASTGGAAGAGGAAASLAGPAALPKQTRQVLTAEFATVLADLGQGARARQVLRSMGASIEPAADAKAVVAFQAAQLKAQAWAVQGMDSALARQAADDLKTKTQAIANAQERARLQGAVAAILSRSTQLPVAVPRQFLSMAAESLKAVSGQSSAVLGDLAVSTAEVFLHETTAGAKSGAWSKAKAGAAQIEDLLKQAPDAWAQANLYAVDHQAKLQTGQPDKANKSLEASLALAAKNNNLLERAIWLRNIARLSDAATQEQFDVATAALLAQLGSKAGLEKAKALTELSLLYTAAGLPAKSSQYRTLAQSTSGLSAADTTAINTDLVVRGDMAMAKMLHGLGRYAEAEALLQRVGAYLF